MMEPERKAIDAAIDEAVAEFIAKLETLAHHAPLRAPVSATAVYKLIHEMAVVTPEPAMLLESAEDAAAELREDFPGTSPGSEGHQGLNPIILLRDKRIRDSNLLRQVGGANEQTVLAER